MSAFSPTEAALEGFRITRENPVAIAYWAVLQLIVSVTLNVLIINYSGAELTEFFRVMTEQASADPADMDQAAINQSMEVFFAALMPAVPWIALSFLISNVLFSGAVMRTVFSRTLGPFGNFRLSMDEVRIFTVVLIKVVLFSALWSVVFGLLPLLVRVVGAVGALLWVLVLLGAIVLALYLAVRLSLAAPQSLIEKRITVMGSWRLSSGRFWPLTGCYLLMTVLYISVWFISMLLAQAVSAIAMLITGIDPTTQDFSTVSSMFTPDQIILLVLGAVLGGLLAAIVHAPAAAVYKMLSTETDVF